MNVMPFPSLPPGWQSAELNALVGSCAATLATGEASGWDTGATERGDPQLYLLGPAPDYDCILCVSRLGRLYVLEDGTGHVLFEHSNFTALTEQIARSLRRKKSEIIAGVTAFWCGLREAFEEKVEPMLAEPVEILTHVAPQLVALA